MSNYLKQNLPKLIDLIDNFQIHSFLNSTSIISLLFQLLSFQQDSHKHSKIQFMENKSHQKHQLTSYYFQVKSFLQVHSKMIKFIQYHNFLVDLIIKNFLFSISQIHSPILIISIALSMENNLVSKNPFASFNNHLSILINSYLLTFINS